MKVKHTQNGNVKIVLSGDQATKLKAIIDRSSRLQEGGDSITQEVEDFSWDLFRAFKEAGVDSAC
ncbi:MULTISPECIES: hypothetical protein [Burkholderia]|uniref:hypothetical protein n=1 Tax=Burkholderia TaxID=32008 RepID=UPI000B7A2D18|nr:MULTISPECIES: hypothetical protein [Burkholderia]MBY4725726.1 hypothetical protein [Burkholderia contaminans]MCI3969264.1 hypothetical protein [Burkholderia sp. HI4860]OXI98498.1 hypothetical protein CFB48_24170 [Burkholderia sp. AU33647]